MLLADRSNLKNTTVGAEHLDTDTLFQYLGVEKLIDTHIFFSAELFFDSNMAILNTSAVRMANGRIDEAAAAAAAGGKEAGGRGARANTIATVDKHLKSVDRQTGGVVARHNNKRFQNLINAENVDKAAAAHGALPVMERESTRSEMNERLPRFSGGWWRYQWRRLRGALMGREPTSPTAPDGRGSVASSSERENGGLSSGTQYLRERMHSETKAILGASFLCRGRLPCALCTRSTWPFMCTGSHPSFPFPRRVPRRSLAEQVKKQATYDKDMFDITETHQVRALLQPLTLCAAWMPSSGAPSQPS